MKNSWILNTPLHIQENNKVVYVHNTTAYEKVVAQPQLVLILVLDWGEWLVSRPAWYNLTKRASFTHSVGGQLDTRACSDL